MTIEIGAPVDAICPRCNADGLVVAAITAGAVSKIRCQECGVVYPEEDEDAPRQRRRPRDERLEITTGPSASTQPKRRQTLLDVEAQPSAARQRTETLIDFEVVVPGRDDS